MTERDPIIIAGAGPAGLSAALALADRGIPVSVFEAEPGLTVDLRAGTYHPPTLEMLAPYGVTGKMLIEGIKVPKWQIRDRQAGAVLAEWDLGRLKDETPYPYRLHLEQHKLTPILLEEARKRPKFSIRFDAKLVAARDAGDHVAAEIETAGGREPVRGSYILGCEGYRSVVRDAMGAAFNGFTWPEMFLITSTTHDFQPEGYTYATYIADPDEWVMLFKMPGMNPPALWRIAMPADPERPREETLHRDGVQQRLQQFSPQSRPYDIVHCNAYRVHQRVAEKFRRGRLLIAGDAAHVNNPLGGMGLNGAVHDAINAADKLAAVWRGEADPSLLDRYERQRLPVQHEYVQQISTRNKKLVEERDPTVRKQSQDELRRTAADPGKAFAFMMDSSMISSIRRANAIR